MDCIETLIEEKIKKIDSTADLRGADRKMLQLACQDFTNYIRFTSKSAFNLCSEEKLLEFSKNKPFELEMFLAVWTSMWVRKWQQRVKLFFGERTKNEQNKNFSNIAKTESNWQTLECKQELVDIAKFTLINNGEICGTQNLAENAIKTELSKSENLKILDKAQALTFMKNVMRRAHEIAKTTGPLMFVEVSKAYYNQ